MIKHDLLTTLAFILVILSSGCGSHASGTSTPSETSGVPESTPTTEGAGSPTATQEATVPLDGRGGGLITFYSERDGDAEIYIMNADGSGQRALTDNDADDQSPSWSTGGDWIVFESDRDDTHPHDCFPNCNYNLYLMDAEGDSVRQLTDLPGAEWNANWSPDGKSLLFTAGEIGFESYGIYTLDMETGESQPLLVDEYENQAAAWSPDGTQIAFSSNRNGNFDIFLMNADGSGVRMVTDSGMDDYMPNWSPDGSRLAFFAANWPTTRQDIYTVNADGSEIINLNSTPQVVDEDPNWSPDGSRIIFQSDRDGNFEIYAMNADGSQPQNLSRDAGRDYWPDWFAPPEADLALVSDHGGNQQIYLLHVPSTLNGQVAVGGDLQPIISDRYEDYFPAWSHDGTQIAFYRHLTRQSWAVMIIGADGGSPRQLTESSGETVCSFAPVWSPDGERIAFSIEPNPIPTCEMKSTEIAVINSDGNGLAVLTGNKANDIPYSWTADGSRLLFTSDREGSDQVYLMDADGSNAQRLTDLDSVNSMPSLSPDGRTIAFVSDRDGNDEIYLMDLDGSDARRLTDNPASDWQPAWSPDGRWIVFTSGSLSGGFDLYMTAIDGGGLRQLTDIPGWQFEPGWRP